jgi:tetratricopeptide (TPR) repeat protein
MSRQLREAEPDFTAAIRLGHSSHSLRPVLGEAWKRRGQTRSALGMELDAIADFSSALQMSPEVELYVERGSTYQKIRNPVAAAADFLEVVRLQPTDSASWRILGMCHMAAGDCQEAVCYAPPSWERWTRHHRPRAVCLLGIHWRGLPRHHAHAAAPCRSIMPCKH